MQKKNFIIIKENIFISSDDLKDNFFSHYLDGITTLEQALDAYESARIELIKYYKDQMWASKDLSEIHTYLAKKFGLTRSEFASLIEKGGLSTYDTYWDGKDSVMIREDNDLILFTNTIGYDSSPDGIEPALGLEEMKEKDLLNEPNNLIKKISELWHKKIELLELGSYHDTWVDACVRLSPAQAIETIKKLRLKKR